MPEMPAWTRTASLERMNKKILPGMWGKAGNDILGL
jgi:hypothetical protein